MTNKARKPGRIKSAVLNWLGFGWSDVEHWRQFMGQDSKSGVRVNAGEALTLSAVWACTRLVAQTIGSLPVGIYKKDGGRRIYDERHPLNRIIGMRANLRMTSSILWECMAASAMLRGDGFAEIDRIGGRVVGLTFLHPDRLRWARQADRSYLFSYTEPDGTFREIPQRDVLHVPGFTTCGPFGLSVIQYGAEVIGGALAANNAAKGTFKNGLMPTTYYKYPKWLTPEQRDTFRDQTIDKLHGSLNAGKPPVLEGGIEVGEIGIDPADAQLLESRGFDIEEICRWFGVPPPMIGHTSKASSWASSSEAMNLWFLQYGLNSWLKRFEDAIRFQLLSPVEQIDTFPKFSVEGLLRADTAGRTSFYSSALDHGWMSRNEVRELEDLQPIPGGDIFTVQSALIPIDQLGSTDSDSNAVRAALMHWLKQPET
jgi:HK97 family phage portal protein